jgi:hypothetical protein
MNVLLIVAQLMANAVTGISSNAAYDYLKQRFQNRTEVTAPELQTAIGDYLVLNGVKADAATVMNLLAQKGILAVSNSQLYAPQSLTVGAAPGAVFSIGDSTTTRTDKTAIQAGAGAYVQGSNAAIVQNPDGSI